MNATVPANGATITRATFRPAPLTRAWAALTIWRNRRAAVRALRALPDELLRDIGIERHQIRDAVYNFRAQPARLDRLDRQPVGDIIRATEARKAA